jgi:predicted nucleic acid-binding protein
MTDARAGQALALYAELPLQRFPHTPLLGRVFSLRENFTAYDAVYVALAEGLDAPLHTADARLARAARAHTELAVVEI